MIFIVFAIIALATRKYLQTLFWTALGAFFLLPRIATVYPEALPGIDGNFASNYWPVLVILLGVGIILYILFGKKRFFRAKIYSSNGNYENVNFNKVEGTDGVYVREVVFGGHDDIFLEPVFRGGNIEIVFGGVKLDLRRTTLPEGDTRLNIDAVFGGAVLHLPDDWVVVPKIAVTFGGVENNRLQVVQNDQTRRLIITGDAVFGGVEIR